VSVPKWLNERALSPKAYGRALTELGLNQSSAARLLGISSRSSRRYASGESNVPPVVALLLRSLIEHGVRFGKRPRRPTAA